jgi:hypothetical protein
METKHAAAIHIARVLVSTLSIVIRLRRCGPSALAVLAHRDAQALTERRHSCPAPEDVEVHASPRGRCEPQDAKTSLGGVLCIVAPPSGAR